MSPHNKHEDLTTASDSEAPERVDAPSKGWYRRQLPHRDDAGLVQFITYRLADSIPATLLEQVEAELHNLSPHYRDAERQQNLEALLDMGHGSAILRDPRAAACVIDNWRHFAGQRYELIAWVIMPTHVHVMIQQYDGESLPKIIQSWKSYTGKRLKALFPQCCVNGEFWEREYWDRFIRDEEHFRNTILYIRDNPVKARLVRSPEEWPYLEIPALYRETPT